MDASTLGAALALMQNKIEGLDAATQAAEKANEAANAAQEAASAANTAAASVDEKVKNAVADYLRTHIETATDEEVNTMLDDIFA